MTYLRQKMLDAEEFIHRFLLHVLPNGFMRIRRFGFLANRRKTKHLGMCRRLLFAPVSGYVLRKNRLKNVIFLFNTLPEGVRGRASPTIKISSQILALKEMRSKK